MFKAGKPASRSRILVVRLGAMGDIIHTLPAVASLKQSHPGCAPHLGWWNRAGVRCSKTTRSSTASSHLRRGVRRRPDRNAGANCAPRRYDFAVDFQGLLKSAVAAALRAARPHLRLPPIAGPRARRRAVLLQ